MSDPMENAKDAISTVYGDMDVAQNVTKERMEELQGFIQDLVDALVCDEVTEVDK